MWIKKYFEKLPDSIFKEPTGNVYKLFQILNQEYEQVKNTTEAIETWRDIDNAKGHTLDELGENVGQARGYSTDEVYRALIRGKAIRNACDGSINRMIDALARTLLCDPKDIGIVSSYEEDNSEPARIIVKSVPLTALNKTGLSPSQFIQIIKSTKAAGVELETVSMEGTFSFSKDNNIEKSEFGFADLEGKSGGTFSEMFIARDDYELPL